MIEYFLMAFFAAGGGGTARDAGTAATPPTAAPAGASASAGTSAAGGADAGTPSTAAVPQHAPVSPAEFKNPVAITADRFEIQGKRNEAEWIGHVKAVRGQTLLSCERLIAHYTKTQEITRIECVGGVEATHGDMWARGERADFDNVAGILVVTGNPEAKKGPNRIQGAKIIFDVARDVISVEGGAKTLFETGATKSPLPKVGGGK